MPQMNDKTNLRITDLNEDCLIKIFSSLALMNWCSLAETCRYFEQITQRNFPKVVTVDTLQNGLRIASMKYLPSGNQTLQGAKRILKKFGSIVESLTIEGFERPVILNVLLEPIFQGLQRLCLHNVIVDVNQNIFANLDSLIELNAWSVDNSIAILGSIFPKLERLRCGRIVQIENPFSTFISCHPRLKILHLDMPSSGMLWKVIADSCKELEELGLWSCRLPHHLAHALASEMTIHFQAMQSLKSLKTLRLWNISLGDFQFLLDLTELRELHLNHCRLPNDFSQLELFTQLKTLDIVEGFTAISFDVVDDVVGRLITLQELSIAELNLRDFVLDEETFSRIVGIVKERPHTLTLKCKFNFDLNSRSSYENQTVRLI